MSQLEEANERLAAAAAEAEGMAEEAAEREEQYRQLCNRLLTLQDEERRRLALELHDSTAQNLAVLIMNLALLEQRRAGARTPNPARYSRRVDHCPMSALERCECARICCTRRCSIRRGWCRLCAGSRTASSKRSGIRVVMLLADIGRLPSPIETALFRVVQESLTNVHRHASRDTRRDSSDDDRRCDRARNP